MNTFLRSFGQAMANLTNILDPDMVVLGGGLSNIDELYTEGVKKVARFIFSDSLETPIVKNKLGIPRASSRSVDRLLILSGLNIPSKPSVTMRPVISNLIFFLKNRINKVKKIR